MRDLSYDDLGRPDCAAIRMNSAAWGTLTAACTLQSAGGDGPDRIGRTLYDLAGQAVQAQTAYGVSGVQATIATSTYTNNGRLLTLTDAENNTTTYVYDGHDRLSRTRYPVATQGSGTSSTTDYEELAYDANSNVTSRRLRDATSIGYTYDALGRLTLKDTPNATYYDPDISYAYDLLGRPTAITSPNLHNLAFGYDALGRQVSETSYFGAKTMQYDLAGRLTRLTWPDAFYVTYDHLVTGEVTHIRENGAASGVGVLATFAYDNLGRRTSLTRGNGTSAAYSYDAASRLSQLVENMPGTSHDLTLGFAYNPAAQITSNTRSNDTFAYPGLANGSRTDVINGRNQVTNTGGSNVSYDARGNVIVYNAIGYYYTSENQLYAGPGGTLLSDPAGRLMMLTNAAQVQTRMDMLGGQQLITELNSSHAILRRYVHGPGVDEPLVWYEGSGTSDRRFLHADERGSIVAVSNSSGAVTNVNSYDEYGVPAATNVGRFQYTGQPYLAEHGLYYYRARVYQPMLGRFLQTDPIGYGGGMNLYAYVGGDPVNLSDPSGLEEDECAVNVKSVRTKGRNERKQGCGDVGPPIVVTGQREIVVTGTRIGPPFATSVIFVNGGRQGLVQNGDRRGSGGGSNPGPRISEEEREEQAEEDYEQCRRLTGVAAARCWQSAADRDAARTWGRPIPDLITESRIAGVIAAGIALYWIISVGSRILFPPRNLIPVP